MKLSIIIVSYNVRYYLEQCLDSIMSATAGITTEVFVVDNHSDDDSTKMVSKLFPSVHLIANNENIGFSKANNQAIQQSTGEYILLLNPDTILEKDTLRQAILFMDQQPKAGGLGAKMLNGQGQFLPESKRGLPTPWAAFCKMSYLSSLFPHSKVFNQYHLGFLSEDEIHEIDILAGAFMLLRKSVLDRIGYLDEDFFMYGEDIDLSHRITLTGYQNYYFPPSRIIHYKGESTRKNSLNYVKMFYGAMLIFARKHYATKNERLLKLVIMPGVYLRAGSAYFRRLFSNSHHPILDVKKQTIDNKSFVFPESGSVIIFASKVEARTIERLLNIKSSFFAITEIPPDDRLERINSPLPKETKVVIVSAKDFSIKEILDLMEKEKKSSIKYLIAYTDKKVVIGSGYVFDGN